MQLPLFFDRPQPVQHALHEIATGGSLEERGAVYTKSYIVEGILDLCFYNTERDLHKLRLLEPAFGNGDFLIVTVKRLIKSCKDKGIDPNQWLSKLQYAIRGIELHKPTYETTFLSVVGLLEKEGLCAIDANKLVSAWLKQDDFLLTRLDECFDVVVGNPPYVRQERIPDALLRTYKHTFKTLYDRADLYVPFYERGLDLLKPDGVLGFICSNRWVKNKFGGPLREKISSGFNLDVYIDLENLDAFRNQVMAYPAITVIRRSKTEKTVIANTKLERQDSVQEIFMEARTKETKTRSKTISVSGFTNGRDPWLFDKPEVIRLLRALEDRFPTLEETEAKVGIGVASGCDKAYIGYFDSLPVEASRKLPLAMAGDIDLQSGFTWSGKGIVNPWLHCGQLASLEDNPLFGAYIRRHETQLRKRHTAKQTPHKWYKTIDRIYPDLCGTPKLLIPDIKGRATVVFDNGLYYPHHNLYHITSNVWNLRALQSLLRSSIALMFVGAYSIKMSGGYLRFQAQYLRRIRLPNFNQLTLEEKKSLIESAESQDQRLLDTIAAKAYGLTKKEAQQAFSFADTFRVTR